MLEEKENKRRRRFLTVMTSVLGLAGAGSLVGSFIASMRPSARARAAGAPVEVDISLLKDGQMLVVEWRGKPVWIVRRTDQMIDGLSQLREKLANPDSDIAQQPSYAQNEFRSIRPNVLVVLGVCTHLGCAPTKNFELGASSGLSDDWLGGFFCPCHGSKFDLAGRVYKNVPAPTNLEVPPYSFISDNRVLIGVGEEGGSV
ncbi:MAG: ubiquinol-cytochrome c reductase iron-sulfur subunit [Acidiferrobacteraceae bacterium]|nr:ubiquinol-cytochrome c reductase iron-sulfur subunit [Acidiferrobacteraceae bacterium]